LTHSLAAMANAFLDMRNQSAADDLSREDWLGLLIDREVTARDNKRLGLRLNLARLRQNAVVEDARSAHAARSRPRPVPIAHNLRLDPRQPPRADRRPNRRGQIMACLRTGP
jgi:hypothetical protein